MKLGFASWAIALTLVCLPGVSWGEDGDADAVIEVTPQQRPHDAPSIAAVKKDDNWYAAALSGISMPYPHSLKFLEDQGAWFTPFTRPGMTGPYDIRGWHRDTVEHDQ